MKTKTITFLFFLLFGSAACMAQEAWTNKSRILPDKLRQVPTILTFSHSPNPNYPELADEPGIETKYVWKHSTSVCSPYQDLEVVEAGSFIWYDETGWKGNMQLNKREFIKRFNCPKGKLEKGQCYTYEKNYRYGDNLYGGDAMWYVIAKDAEGNLVKGFGILETEAELKKD
ncbi:MAG: hypothetical protein AAGC47_11380 [Bacteroidota bacterium]